MKEFTLSNCTNRINQILNYPSVAYEDISHFFDQAISELNTTLHTSIPTVTEMLSEVPKPDYTPLVKITSIASNDISITKPTSPSGNDYYFDTENGNFKVYAGAGEWKTYDKLYGVVYGSGNLQMYESVIVGSVGAYWTPVVESTLALNLVEYLPSEWIILFIIPYVCYKYSVREGMDPGIFSEELTQGFQQLQESYDVRETVRLSEVADKYAYRQIVKENLDSLNQEVPTRAIYDSMKVRRAINATYRDFYNGGWGL